MFTGIHDSSSCHFGPEQNPGYGYGCMEHYAGNHCHSAANRYILLHWCGYF